MGRERAGWLAGLVTILGGLAPAGGTVTAVARTSNKLDVFVGGDGFVYTAAWEGGVNNNAWAGWWRIGTLGSIPGSRVSVVTRKLS